MLNPRLTLVLILVILTAITAAGGNPGHESRIDASFDLFHSDANAEGTGYLIGIPRPTTEPNDVLYFGLNGEVHVETWTRYYHMIAGVHIQDPDRPDERTLVDYGAAHGALITHGADADLTVMAREDQGTMTVSTPIPAIRFEAKRDYLYTSGTRLPGELAEIAEPEPPDDPRFFHAFGEKANFEHVDDDPDGWIDVQGSFTITFIHGDFELHNKTGAHHIHADRERIDGNPPVYGEYSITRAYIHVTNGNANLHAGGRPTQFNMADFDIPSTSAILLANATGTWTHEDQEIPFSSAHVHVSGDNLGFTSKPYLQGNTLTQKGGIHGPIEEVVIDGRPVEPEPRSTTTNETLFPTTLLFVAAAAVAALTVLAYLGYRVLRRRRAQSYTLRAEILCDAQEYERAAHWARKAVCFDPRSTEATSILAITALRSGDVDKAIACLERTQDQEDPLLQLLLAVALRDVGEPAQARRMIRGLLKDHPHLYEFVANTDLIIYDAAEDQDDTLDLGYA